MTGRKKNSKSYFIFKKTWILGAFFVLLLGMFFWNGLISFPPIQPINGPEEKSALPVKAPILSKTRSQGIPLMPNHFQRTPKNHLGQFEFPPQPILWDGSCLSSKGERRPSTWEELTKPLNIDSREILISHLRVEDFSFFYEEKGRYFTVGAVWQMNEPPSYAMTLYRASSPNDENPLLIDPNLEVETSPSLKMLTLTQVYDFVTQKKALYAEGVGSRVVLLSVKAPSLRNGLSLLNHRMELYNSWARAYTSGDLECHAPTHSDRPPIPPSLSCRCGDFTVQSFP
jgi:hypothetical protein